MLSQEKILEIETAIYELNNLNEVLSINLEKYSEMYNKGFGCAYITDLMQDKIDYIKSLL